MKIWFWDKIGCVCVVAALIIDWLEPKLSVFWFILSYRFTMCWLVPAPVLDNVYSVNELKKRRLIGPGELNLC